MAAREDYDSDVPEEFTSQKGIQQYEEIIKVQQQSKARVRREGKERRKKLAERLTPRPKTKVEVCDDDDEMVEDEEGADTNKQSQINKGMLPNDIVNLLAAREKQVFVSDSEDEEEKVSKPKSKKKKNNTSGVENVILKELPTAHCVQNALEFLTKRKAQVPRSAAVLNNSNQALRLLSSSGVLK
ncbi:unnamed protein product [Amaranthus hypochondriacus]